MKIRSFGGLIMADAVSPKETELRRMVYFGPWDEPGHHHRWESGASVYRPIEFLPWGYECDGGLQPHSETCRRHDDCSGCVPQGRALIHHKCGWTALAFWDRSVDTRPGSCSVYFAEGTFTFEEMVAMAKERFAERWNKMQFEVTHGN